MNITDNTFCIVDTTYCTIYDFTETLEQADAVLQKAIARTLESVATWEHHAKYYPDPNRFFVHLEHEKSKLWSIMTYGEFKIYERKKLLAEPMHEITEETFNDQLNVLPPIKWCTINGVEMFCMSEMFTGFYTSQYAHDKRTGKFYSKLVDLTDKATWINTLLA